jgi:O-Antigen ligase
VSSRPARRSSKAFPVAGLVGFALTLIPVAAALRLTGHGGGYTIDQWGLWAAVTVVAAGVALVSQPVSRLSGVQRLFPLALLGLSLWSMASVHWAAWPQSALVEADRYLFYAAAATLPLVLLPTAGWRRGLVGGVAAGAALPALLVALKLWQSGNSAALFDAGRLVGSIGYGGGLAAAVAIAFWPLVAFASDRSTARALRPLAGLGAGLALATVVPTEARASVWALALSALVFFLLCPTPIRSGVVAAGAALPTLLFWHQLNSVFSSQTGGHPHSVGIAILLTGMLSALVAGGQTVLDEFVTLSEASRRAVAIAFAVWVFLVVLVGAVGVLAVTDGHPVGWTRHTLQRTVDRVGGDGGQAAGEGQAGSRFGSLDTGRYDLWKVALRGFRAQPAKGVGAGNFGYLNVRIGRPFLFPYQAHSQLLEEASTLGLPALALFSIVLGLPLGACIWVRLRSPSRPERLLAAGIGGSLGYFAAHGQVDWIWQLSSCALPAMLLSGVAVGMLPPAPERRRSAVTGGVALAASVAAAALLIVPAALAQRYLERSYHEPAAAALADARRAGDLDRLSGRPQLAAARALLRTGDTAGALADARRAAGAEPGFWVAWQLLAVAAAREGDRATAAAAHERVRRLAPLLPLDLRGEVPGPSFDHY